jgi:predicted transposase/invertase (TIGR01784 family)
MSTYDAIKIEGKLEGKIEGKLEGKIEGKLEGKIEIILSLNKDKLPISQIAKYANLSEDEVTKILKNKGEKTT